jgi:hypothetical protein
VSTVPEPGPSVLPEQYRGLLDDAAIFPPANLALSDALDAHRGHLASAYAGLLGSFVVSDVRLPELLELVRQEGGPPLAVSVVVTGGAGALEPAVRWATGSGELDLRGVEIALRDEMDLAHNARRMTTAVDQLRATGDLGEDVGVYVEPPRLLGQPPTHSWLQALDEVAAMDLRVKFRTGGTTPDAFPGAPELAACIGAALDRELRFKCTAGLHHALRHRDHEAFDRPVDRHGFLNVLLATRAALDGAAPDEVAAVLDESDPAAVASRAAETGAGPLVSARRWFTAVGSCSVLEPLADLTDLGLLPDLTREHG